MIVFKRYQQLNDIVFLTRLFYPKEGSSGKIAKIFLRLSLEMLEVTLQKSCMNIYLKYTAAVPRKEPKSFPVIYI